MKQFCNDNKNSNKRNNISYMLEYNSIYRRRIITPLMIDARDKNNLSFTQLKWKAKKDLFFCDIASKINGSWHHRALCNSQSETRSSTREQRNRQKKTSGNSRNRSKSKLPLFNFKRFSALSRILSPFQRHGSAGSFLRSTCARWSPNCHHSEKNSNFLLENNNFFLCCHRL